MNIIVTENLTKIYNTGMKKGGIKACDNVSLNIPQGEIFGLLGPNGAGKTTFFKSLLGIISITSGKATIHGLPTSDPDSRLKIGYLPENHRFPEYLTGYGLMKLTGKLCAVSNRDINDRIDQLLDLVGMSQWGEMKLKKYSKGMLQRIGLAQAMINDPDILFLDEPTDGVDPVGKSEIRTVLKKIRDDGKSILLNSHLLAEVETVADRVAIMQQGQVVKIGSVEELTSRGLQYEIEADFGEITFNLPSDSGTVNHITRERMVVELEKEKDINKVIDFIRSKNILIRSVKPVKISLEQSFIETVSGGGE